MLQQNEVLITRIFDAPREMVFNAWTQPDQLVLWYAPGDCTIQIKKFDFRKGGSFHTCIKATAHNDCWCTGVYHEIVAPEKIVFSMLIADENGNKITAAEAGMDPEWPAETIVTVTFDDDNGKTKLTLHQTVAESVAKRTGAYPSWLDMFRKLDNILLLSEAQR
jgi:uncharacterized protein YndB with AHSA1/START domain